MRLIEMRRRKDGKAYRFLPIASDDGATLYRREDRNIVLRRDRSFGWIVWDEESESLMARPWTTPVSQQTEQPPEGVWVSRRGDDSFVYQLVFI